MTAHYPEIFFTAEQITALLDPQDWKILVAESRPRTIRDHLQQVATRYDDVLRAQRLEQPGSHRHNGATT